MTTPQWWHASSHRIWGVVHIVAVTAAALVLGYVNANHFDTGEIMTALGSVGVARAIFGARPS